MRTELPTLVYTFGGGRLGNQLIRFAHWLAWLEEHSGKVGLINAGFWPYAKHFAHWSAHPACGVPSAPAWARGLSCFQDALPDWLSEKAGWRVLRALHSMGDRLSGWQRMGSLTSLAEIDLDDSSVVGKVGQARVTTCAGWRIAGWGLLKKHELRVRRLLAPQPSLAKEADAFVESLRAHSPGVVGVLIRQTDYRTWRDGAFYHPSACYAKWMREFREYQGGKDITFLVTSDEVQDPAVFAGLKVAFSTGSANAGGAAVSALLELSRCDAILAPPSTFSAWASHWGNVPYHVLSTAPAWDRPVAGAIDSLRRDPVLSQVVK